MPKTLNLAQVFKLEADALKRARERAISIHRTDIRAAGNEVEQAVRDYLKRVLSPRYYVTSGHLIDSKHLVSPQLDVIIADQFNLPSFLTTEDGTEYIPVTSVLAIGEVKSTYYHSQDYYRKFHRVLTEISEMDRPLVENTMYGGMKGSTILRDIILGSTNKYLNNLYSFLICVDGGDFDFTKIKNFLVSTGPELLPNLAVFLDKGIVAYSNYNKERELHKYPIEVKGSGYSWCFMQGAEVDDGSVEGIHLATLHGQLISHLSSSQLEPPNAYQYTRNMSVFRKSSLMWANE